MEIVCILIAPEYTVFGVKLIAWAGLDHFNITYLEFETKEQAFAYEQVQTSLY